MNPKISHSLRRFGRWTAVVLMGGFALLAQTPRPHPAVSAQEPVAAPFPGGQAVTPPGPSQGRTYRPADPALQGAARVLAMTGQVSVLRDDVPWALTIGDTVNPEQIVITGSDGYAEFQVADGSHFEVFQNSRVIFRNNPGDWRDLIDVLIGKIKVQIERLGGVPNPNKVRTPTAVISVRGTVFDVDVEDEDATTLVLVEEGQVEVRHLLRGGDGRVLNEGEWIRIYKNQPIAVKVVDRGAVMQRALRAGMDAVYQAILNNPASGVKTTGAAGGTTGGGTGTVGDTCPQHNCSSTPPPPPAPPPHS